MGTGISGKYYTSKGSRIIHHQAIEHSMVGKFSINPRTGEVSKFISGGHGQDNIDFLKTKNIDFNIIKTYSNGVRVGNVPKHDKKQKRKGSGQSWFPQSWTQKDIVAAAEHVVGLKRNRHKKDGQIAWGKWDGVWVGVIKTNGNVATVFPDSDQSDKKKGR